MTVRVLARAARPARRLFPRVGLALVYHRIGSRENGGREELVPRLDAAAFAAQLEHLQATYRLVPASGLVEAVRSWRPGRRSPVALTFDDDLASHLELAAPALGRAGVPAAFFLCGASLDGPHAFWWDDLQELADSGFFEREASLGGRVDFSGLRHGVPGALQAAAAAIEGLPPEERDAVAAELRACACRRPDGLDERGVRQLLDAGFDIGFHTRAHYLLPRLDDAALAVALSDGRAALEALAGKRLTMISYPHGKADARVASAARAAGYEVGFTCVAVPARPGSDPLLIGRLDAQAVPPADFPRVVAATLARGRASVTA
jgi:peptidoglycan/xylan/chitin deacetylase (PgdA/CDA1 family)